MAVWIAVALSGGAACAQDMGALSKAEGCIPVEIVMYSGRPHPVIQVCDEVGKKEILSAVSAVNDAVKDPSSVGPALKSTPAYQGLVVHLPGDGTHDARMTHVHDGYLRENGRIGNDPGRSSERRILSVIEAGNDVSPAGGNAPVKDLADRIRRELDSAK